MSRIDWKERIVPTLMVAGVVSLVLSLVLGGFIVYQWVLAIEATAASIAMLVYYFLHFRHAPRKLKWPPLLPMSLIGLSGGAKSFYVATGADTPMFVVIILFIAVGWFTLASLQTLKAKRRIGSNTK